MISNDQSNPIISLIPELLGLFTIYHRVENEVIDVTALRQQLYRAKICPEEMAVVFALSGGDLCPPTQHIRMICFADALIRYRHKLKPFIYPELWDDVSRYSEQNWLNMENVIAAAYVVSLQSTNIIKDPQKSMFSKLNPDDETQDWAHQVRKWVAQLKRVDRATRFMPEKADLQLQLRRAVWLLRYSKCAIKFGCQDEQQQSQYGEQGNDGDSYGNHAQMEMWGFAVDGAPLLEKPEDLAVREKILRYDYQRCSCKGGCNTSRCSCVRHNPPIYCTICDCSAEACRNRGALEKTSILRSEEVARMEDRACLEQEDDSSFDDSEDDSSSDGSIVIDN